jgi:hypothetical protein
MILQREGKGGIKERSNNKRERKEGGKYERNRGDIVMSLVICQNHW